MSTALFYQPFCTLNFYILNSAFMDSVVWLVHLYSYIWMLNWFYRRFGTWPVAMLAPSKNKAILEGPVCNASQVIGWHTNEKSKRLRRFHVDMSGFAFNSTILWDPKRWRRPTSNPIRQLDTVKEGFQVCLLSLLLFNFPHPINIICNSYNQQTDITFGLTGDNLYRTIGGRWESNGRFTAWLFENNELASPFGCS